MGILCAVAFTGCATNKTSTYECGESTVYSECKTFFGNYDEDCVKKNIVNHIHGEMNNDPNPFYDHNIFRNEN